MAYGGARAVVRGGVGDAKQRAARALMSRFLCVANSSSRISLHLPDAYLAHYWSRSRPASGRIPPPTSSRPWREFTGDAKQPCYHLSAKQPRPPIMLPRLLLLAAKRAASTPTAEASLTTLTTRASFATKSATPLADLPLLAKRASSATTPIAAATASLAASIRASFATKAPKTATPPADLNRGATADLLDIFHPHSVDEISAAPPPGTPGAVQIAEPIFRDFGAKLRFSGRAATIKCFENNPLVRAALEEKGEGRVLVVDGGGSKRCALLGDNIAAMGARNGWSGIIINGCVRDTADLATFDLGVKALAAYPLKSSKRDRGQRDVAVSFAGVTVKPGDWVYADGDGVIVSDKELRLQSDV